MKEIDDTNPTEITTTEVLEAITATMKTFRAKIVALEKQMVNNAVDKDSFHLRIANLEARKPPQDTNPDSEWFA